LIRSVEGAGRAALGLHLRDGDRLAVFGAPEALTEIDLATGSVVRGASREPPAHPGSRVFVAHGGSFAAVLGDGLTLWDLRTPRRIARVGPSEPAMGPGRRGSVVPSALSAVVRCALSADGRAMMTGDHLGRIRFARWTDP
jgi:hypothetical protein